MMLKQLANLEYISKTICFVIISKIPNDHKLGVEVQKEGFHLNARKTICYLTISQVLHYKINHNSSILVIY